MSGKILLPALVFGVAQCASAVYQITSFEDGVYAPLDATQRSTELSTLHVTDGQYSMKVNDLKGGWSWVYGSYGSDVYDQWFNNTKLLLDVYFPARTDFQQVQLGLAVNSDNGWKQDVQINWQWLNAGTDLKATVSWDYSAAVDKSITKSGWVQFFVLASIPGKGTSLSYPLDIYVDNLRLDGAPVPEPMTMIALGGGLLAVGLRRRRK